MMLGSLRLQRHSLRRLNSICPCSANYFSLRLDTDANSIGFSATQSDSSKSRELSNESFLRTTRHVFQEYLKYNLPSLHPYNPNRPLSAVNIDLFLNKQFDRFSPIALVHLLHCIHRDGISLKTEHATEGSQGLKWLGHVDPKVCEVSSEFSNKLLQWLRTKGKIENLRDFRRYFFVQKDVKEIKSCLLRFHFEIRDINHTITHCLENNATSEAYQWYNIATNVQHVNVNGTTFNILLPALAELNSWDAFYSVYNDFQWFRETESNSTLSRKALNAILHCACKAPERRWRDIIRIIMDIQESGSTVGTGKGYAIDPASFAEAIQSLRYMQKYTEIRQLYDLVSHPQQYRKHSNLPVFHHQVSSALSVAAMQIGPEFLFRVLKNMYLFESFPELIEIDSIVDESLPAMEDYSKLMSNSHKLRESFRRIWANASTRLNTDVQSTAPLESSMQCDGIRLMWLLYSEQKEEVLVLWNAFVESHAESSATDKSSRTLSKATANALLSPSLQYLLQFSSSNPYDTADIRLRFISFLNAVLFPNADLSSSRYLSSHSSITTSSDNTSVPAPLPISSSSTVEFTGLYIADIQLSSELATYLVHVYKTQQDSHSVAAILARCITQNISIDQETVTAALRQLNHDHDAQLVLDLFTLYEDRFLSKSSMSSLQMNPKPLSIDDIAPPSHANPSDISQSQDTSKNKIIVSNKRKHSKESTRNVVLKRSPAIYGEAMTAMIELGDIDQMLFLLCRDLTSKGYLPAKGLLVPALNALVKHARYKDGLNLFRFLHEQRLKESLANYGVDAPHKRVVYELYGDSKIFALLLECCAQGRFGMEAIQLYSEREDFLAKNLVDRSDSYYSQRYILQVIVSLSTNATCEVIPAFLSSMSQLSRPLLVNDVMIATALSSVLTLCRDDLTSSLLSLVSSNGINLNDVTEEKIILSAQKYFNLSKEEAKERLSECAALQSALRQ